LFTISVGFLRLVKTPFLELVDVEKIGSKASIDNHVART